jgi:hypothetical protein
VIYQIDTTSIRFRRINILHISTLELSTFGAALSTVVDHIFNVFPTQEIRISLYHSENSEGKLVVAPEVK